MSCYGIDQAGFYTSAYYLPLVRLAQYHNLPADYFQQRIGQKEMAIAAPGEDIVTLAANACQGVLTEEDKDSIELLLFATESSVDQSKSAAIYLHKLLGLGPRCRSLELKQACYSSTAALQLAQHWLQANPNKKALLVAADIAHYPLNHHAEASQGAGAVALLLSRQPRLLEIEAGSGLATQDIADFWRPNYSKVAMVDGPKSCEAYLKLLRNTWGDYQLQTKRDLHDHQHFCFHVPFPKLVETAMQKLARFNNPRKISRDLIKNWLSSGLDYNRQIGNCYTGSLYVSLISLLENHAGDLGDKRIGIYSYGSGSTAEYFSMRVRPGYDKYLHAVAHQDMLQQRTPLDIQQYHLFHNFNYIQDGGLQQIPEYNTGRFRLNKIEQHLRHYTTLNNQESALDEAMDCIEA